MLLPYSACVIVSLFLGNYTNATFSVRPSWTAFLRLLSPHKPPTEHSFSLLPDNQKKRVIYFTKMTFLLEIAVHTWKYLAWGTYSSLDFFFSILNILYFFWLKDKQWRMISYCTDHFHSITCSQSHQWQIEWANCFEYRVLYLKRIRWRGSGRVEEDYTDVAHSCAEQDIWYGVIF